MKNGTFFSGFVWSREYENHRRALRSLPSRLYGSGKRPFQPNVTEFPTTAVSA